MDAGAETRQVLENEARALLTRLARVRSFALYETMVPAAALSLEAQVGIERYLVQGRQALRRQVEEYLIWLHSPQAAGLPPEALRRRLTMLRLQFNAVLAQFDIFADVVTQRSEHETGVWLSGLDEAAEDALALPGDYYDAPPVICYLARGLGGTIRRARTRLPGGGQNPVAVIMIPRERMIGAGIASSLVHEAGHQGAALLDLVPSLQPLLRGMQRGGGYQRTAWYCWERWISEILADLWAVARLGITATHGLIGVVSLPRYFVFRLKLDDPHPAPWIRVKLGCLIGKELYPDPQWDALAQLWSSFYPPTDLQTEQQRLLAALEESMPSFVTLLLEHRPQALRGRSLREVLSSADRRTSALRGFYQAWRHDPAGFQGAAPCLAFAIIGQARADKLISPEAESHLLDRLLTHWAVRSTLDRSATYSDTIAGQPALARRGLIWAEGVMSG